MVGVARLELAASWSRKFGGIISLKRQKALRIKGFRRFFVVFPCPQSGDKGRKTLPKTADLRRFRGRWGGRWGCLDGGKNGVDIVGKVLRSVAH